VSHRYRAYYVYIMANLTRTIYIGMTSDLEVRVAQHKLKVLPGFTRRYGLNRLVYYEEHPYVYDAIAREKQLKGWLRSKKIALIESMNPEWADLSEGWA
jgi:putative endonuclease